MELTLTGKTARYGVRQARQNRAAAAPVVVPPRMRDVVNHAEVELASTPHPGRAPLEQVYMVAFVGND